MSFKVKSMVHAVTQKLRPITLNLMDKLKENLDTLAGEELIEGPLGPEHGTRLLQNIVSAIKKWDQSKIRITLDTRAHNKLILTLCPLTHT